MKIICVIMIMVGVALTGMSIGAELAGESGSNYILASLACLIVAMFTRGK